MNEAEWVMAGGHDHAHSERHSMTPLLASCVLAVTHLTQNPEEYPASPLWNLPMLKTGFSSKCPIANLAEDGTNIKVSV
ncbi:hypothetical protein [Tunturiibacter gelidiferens]|uniref:Uncharacterized protein n=1 Tax=Tunturiibacter gelidiferens TaxID=3069689 RepID=A0AAU7YZB2_9BACT